MDPVLECLSMELDYEIGKLPESWTDYCTHDIIVSEDFSAMTSALKKILGYLKATGIKHSTWNNNNIVIGFNPVTSPYFRFTRTEEDVPIDYVFKTRFPIDENLRGVIAIGFSKIIHDDPLESPYLLTYYTNKNGRMKLLTEMSYYEAKEWKHAFGEFFNLPD